MRRELLVVFCYLLLLETLQQVVASLLPLRRRAGPFRWCQPHLACHIHISIPVSYPPQARASPSETSQVEKGEVANDLNFTHPGGSGDAPRCVGVRPHTAACAPRPAALCPPRQTTLSLLREGGGRGFWLYSVSACRDEKSGDNGAWSPMEYTVVGWDSPCGDDLGDHRYMSRTLTAHPSGCTHTHHAHGIYVPRR